MQCTAIPDLEVPTLSVERAHEEDWGLIPTFLHASKSSLAEEIFNPPYHWFHIENYFYHQDLVKTPDLSTQICQVSQIHHLSGIYFLRL